MNESFRKADELINSFFGYISNNNKEAENIVFSWRQILMQLRNSKTQSDTERMDTVSQLADHSKVIDYRNNTLFIETDHPARLQLFQMYKGSILNSINKIYPELKIKNISFFIGKQKKESKTELRDVTSEEIEKAIEKRTCEDLENYDYPKKEVPEEVKKLFEGFF